MKLTEQDWAAATIHLDSLIDRYLLALSIPGANPFFALAVLRRLSARLSTGERTELLYKEIMVSE